MPSLQSVLSLRHFLRLSTCLSLSIGLSGCGIIDFLGPLISETPTEQSETASELDNGESLPEVSTRKVADESGQENSLDETRVVSATYEIELSSETEGDVRIQIPIATQYLPEDSEAFQLRPERYNPETNTWEIVGSFPTYNAETQRLWFADKPPFDNPLSTQFLTQQSAAPALVKKTFKYRVRIYLFTNMLTVQRENSHFRIHYYPTSIANRHKVVSDATWGSPGRSEEERIPNFVEDLDAALTKTYKAFLTLEHNTGKLFKALPVQDVYIEDTGSAAGNSSLGGPMAISNKLITNREDLELTVAHEMTHVFQGQYYGAKGLWTGRQNTSFIEATANYFATRLSGVSDERKAAFYLDGASEYLGVSLYKNNANSMYAAGHFLDTLSQKYGEKLIPEALRLSSGNDWSGLSKAITQVDKKVNLVKAYGDYVTAIMTEPENMGAFNLSARNNLASHSTQFMKPNNFFNNDNTYSIIDKPLPAYTSALAWMYFRNLDDALLVIDGRKSTGSFLSSLTYTHESGQNKDYTKWSPLEKASAPLVGEVVTVPHVGKDTPVAELNQWFMNTGSYSQARAHSVYYLLRPPVVSESGSDYVYWKLSTLGNIPRDFIKGFRVYYRYPGSYSKTWNQIGGLQKVAWGQSEQRYRHDRSLTNTNGDKPEFLISVVDHLDHEWPDQNTQSKQRKISLSVDIKKWEQMLAGNEMPDTGYLPYNTIVPLIAEVSNLDDETLKWEVVRQDPKTCGDYELYCAGPLGTLTVNGKTAIYRSPSDFASHSVRVSSVAHPEINDSVYFHTNGVGFCVAEETPVTLADGSTRPISKLRAGDAIKGWDETQNAVVTAKVQAVLKHAEARYLYTLTAADGDTLKITGNHPVYTREAGWIPLEQLKTGMTVYQWDQSTQSFKDNTVIQIIRDASTTGVVYNLKTTSHNYFASDLLIHNKCLAKDTYIDTPAGHRAVQDLQPGDTVWTLKAGKQVPTVITHVYRKETVLPVIPGKVIAPGQYVTVNHQIWHEGQWTRAGKTNLEDIFIAGAVYDLATAEGHYLASGVFMGEPSL